MQALPTAVYSSPVLLRVREPVSWPTVMLSVAVLLVNYLPVLLFVPIGTAPKFALVIALLVFAWLAGLRSGVLEGRSDRYMPYGLFFAYYLYAVLSMVINGEHVNNALTIFGIVVMQPLIVFASIMLRDRKRSFVLVMAWGSGVIFAMVGYLLLVQGSLELLRIGETYQNINMYLGIFASLMLSMEAKTLWRGVVAKTLALLAVFCMLLVGGRAAVVAVMAVFLIFTAFVGRKKGFQVAFLIVLIVLALLYWNLIADTRFFQRMIGLAGDDDSSKRIFLFTKAIELFKSNFVFGAGINAFPAYINKFEEGWYPHNIFLDVASSLGVIGLVLFSAFIMYAIYDFMRFRKLTDRYSIQSFCVFIYVLITYQFVGELVAAWLLYLALGMSLPNTKLTLAHLRRRSRLHPAPVAPLSSPSQ